MKGVIVPRKAVQSLIQFIDDSLSGGGSAKPVSVETDENTVRFTLEKASLTTKLIDGAFPDYTRVVPKNNDTLLTAPAASPCSPPSNAHLSLPPQPDQSQAVRLALKKGELTLSANARPSANTKTRWMSGLTPKS